ncbi:MAG TPA: THUMP domain-containing protein [Patescibacteria group bacterium]|nr:THUMP domain-containing protein [Patescibacteria group bacterium]
MFAYQNDGRFFAQAGRGFEELAAAELTELGALDIEISGGGLYFRCDAAGLYRINYCSRLVSRVLAPLAVFPCLSDQALYEVARALEWQALLTPEKTFAVFANVRESRINHAHFAALRLKDAIADHFRERIGRRPDVDTEHPDVWINLVIRQDRAVISLDTAGGSLHRRGYRVQSVPAPLQETLAAAMVRLSGWQGERPLVDPMCGSGTILAEAFMQFCRIPAAFKKEKFGFEAMPDFDPRIWAEVRRESDASRREMPELLIRGSDSDRQAIDAARRNLREIPGSRGVPLDRKDFRDLPGITEATIICNPPYGIRVGELEETRLLYKEFGDFLKQRCQGSTAYVLCGNLDLIGAIGLKPSRRFVLFNGPIECRLLKIEIY